MYTHYVQYILTHHENISIIFLYETNNITKLTTCFL